MCVYALQNVLYDRFIEEYAFAAIHLSRTSGDNVGGVFNGCWGDVGAVLAGMFDALSVDDVGEAATPSEGAALGAEGAGVKLNITLGVMDTVVGKYVDTVVVKKLGTCWSLHVAHTSSSPWNVPYPTACILPHSVQHTAACNHHSPAHSNNAPPHLTHPSTE